MLDVVSEMTIAISAATAETASRLVTPRASAMPVPRVSASPVSESSVPSTMPHPNRMTVPQSILTASFQFMVNRRRSQSIGQQEQQHRAR